MELFFEPKNRWNYFQNRWIFLPIFWFDFFCNFQKHDFFRACGALFIFWFDFFCNFQKPDFFFAPAARFLNIIISFYTPCGTSTAGGGIFCTFCILSISKYVSAGRTFIKPQELYKSKKLYWRRFI